MKYDFTSIIERRGHDAIAVDAMGSGVWGAPNLPVEDVEPIPMWVADMNFPALPAIQEHIIERVKHPAYGYFLPSEEYYRSIIDWQTRRNCFCDLKQEYIGYENGVLGGLMSALRALCLPGESILVHSPTYIGFTHSLNNAGYKIVHSPLALDEQNIWRMDLADMEEKIRENDIHVLIFCSPHNPTGRVWTREELEEVVALCAKYDVYVISDEIWADLVLTTSPQPHLPFLMVSEEAKKRTIALYAPSKTFNLAGLIGSYHIIYDKRLKTLVDRASSLSHYNGMNILSMHALIGAYSEEGHVWVDELREVLTENVNFAIREIREKFEGIEVAAPEGTYMLFLDAKQWCEAHNKTVKELLKMGWDVGVGWQDGVQFGGTHTIRMNLALPKSRVEEACARLRKVL